MATLNDLISTFTETELNMTVPLDLQDVSESDLHTVNEYNGYLSEGNYSNAAEFRNNHPELEKYILDVKKINMLQAMWMNAYLYARKAKQQCAIDVNEPISQEEGDIWFKVDTQQSNDDYLYCTSYYKDDNGDYKEFSFLSSSMFEEITDDEINAIVDNI